MDSLKMTLKNRKVQMEFLDRQLETVAIVCEPYVKIVQQLGKIAIIEFVERPEERDE